MKPDDDSGRLPTAQRPFRVLIIAASNRRQYNCPGVASKARALMLRMAECLPQEWEIDYEDLGNVFGRARIQSCLPARRTVLETRRPLLRTAAAHLNSQSCT